MFIDETSDESNESLQVKILSLCKDALDVEVDIKDLNYVNRLGKQKRNTEKPRPAVMSLVSNIMKKKILFSTAKLKGANIFITEDYDKETQLQRKELLKIHLGMRATGQQSKLRRNGLLLNGKFIHFSELIEKYKSYSDKLELNIEDANFKQREIDENIRKKRRINGKDTSFRRGSDSAASSPANKD
ncbi:hypothetical protein O3M35_011633 [Rhynocoris fuscipes]|uniref:Uncharacterized protein n=1 Tax=Rhynocoris fuscipes TaxID=488301 RepID=A0AAW1CVW8_9HEMI